MPIMPVKPATGGAPTTSLPWTSITAKPTFATVATSGAYTDLSSKPTTVSAAGLTDAATMPWCQAQFLTASSLSGYATTSSLSGYVTSSALTSSLSPYATTASLSSYATTASLGSYVSNTALTSTLSSYVTTSSLTTSLSAYTTSAALTTTLSSYATTSALTSGLATKFTTPTGTTSQYIRGDGSLASFPGLFDGSYASLTGKPALATVATSGSYVDLTNKPTIVSVLVGTPVTKSARALATAYQATDPTKPTLVTLSITSTSSISLSGTSNNEGGIYIGATSAVATSSGTRLAEYKNSLGGGLVVGLTITTSQTQPYSFVLPVGWYYSIIQNTGTGMSVVSAFDQSLT